jgi:ATP-dependent RNA helicase RhlE
MGFSKVGLSDAVLQGVSASGYHSPTEIQQKAIPLALAGKDVIGCAPTGTGKTAAFVLPMLHCLEQADPETNGKRFPRALILTPTRELAAQIETAVRTYGVYSSLQPVAVYGGVNINQQIRNLKDGADIVVATPGRLLELAIRNSIDLSHIRILVIDEADRMFDMGFIDAVRNIIGRIPRDRQTLLFSATMSPEVRSLVAKVQKEPHLIEIGQPFVPVNTVQQHIFRVPQRSKGDMLLHIIKSEPIETMLVFSRTKHGADRIARHLQRAGVTCEAIHSNRSQSQRQHTLEGFKRRDFRVLVATDVAARGIDIDGISHVVNYDTPQHPEDYIHRIGRTGRAENTGTAYTFVSADEMQYLARIESLIGRRFEAKGYPGFTAAEQDVPSSGSDRRFPFSGRKKCSFGSHRFHSRRS